MYKQKLALREKWFNVSHILVRGVHISWAIQLKFVTKIPLNVTEQMRLNIELYLRAKIEFYSCFLYLSSNFV